MMAKTIADRVAGKCSHTIPVYVPCRDCVEAQLAVWEKRIRQETAREIMNDVHEQLDNAAKWKAECERLTEKHKAFLESIEGLKASNLSLSEMSKSLMIEIQDLRAQLNAEQSMKSYVRIAQGAE